jgi:hypothetical protein
MQQEWSIQPRAERCAVTGQPFGDGEYFYTVLYDEKTGFRREDLSEKAWQERTSRRGAEPFSFWRAKFEVPPPTVANALKKETAEELLRRYMAEETAQHGNARYILALMLERKRLLKQIDTKMTEQGERALIYEHTKSGEVFLIPDPQLRLDQMADVQAQVAELLSHSAAPRP